MANIGRGTYEPPGDDIHVFDGSEDDDVEGSRLPLLIVIALFVLAAFAGVVWLAYTQGVARGRSDVPRVIAAQPGPAKVAANGNGAVATPYKGLKIYEQPAPADEEADRQAAPPAPTVKTPPTTMSPATTVATPRQSAAGETEVAKEPPLSVAKSIVPPVAKPITPAASAPSGEATAPPAPLEKKSVASSSGAFVLQIGAYKSEAEANSAWNVYHAKHASLLSGHAQDIKKVDLGDKGIWYRLRVGSFSDKDAAKEFCAKLTAEGGACFPAK